VYLVQFGLIGVLGVRGLVRRIRRRTLTDRQRDAAAIAAAIAVLVTVVRPPIGTPNNLFARPLLVVLMVLAGFAAAEWAEPGRRWLRAAALAVSVAGTALAVAGATAEGALFWPTRPDVVGAAHWINGHTPPDAVVADASAQPGLGYWLWRRTLVSDRRLAQLFGATAAQYADATERLRDASDAPSSLSAWQRFRDLRADVVLMDAPVPAWAQPPCFRLADTIGTFVVLMRAPGCPSAP
jgi:hypothetical protein